MTTAPARPKGVFALLLTPFADDGAIDWKAYEEYAAWQVGSGADGLFAVCGSSEMACIASDERLELCRRAVAAARPLPVVATANLEEDPKEHPAEIRRMADAGAAGVVLVPHPRLGDDPARILDYYGGLVECSPVPVLLYEWPHVRPHLVPPAVLGRLAGLGVVGIKDTTCTVEGVAAKAQAAPSVTIFQANTPLLRETLSVGIGGIMAITSTAYADLAAEFWRAAREDPGGGEAAALHARLVVLDCLLGQGYPASAKWLVRRRGLPFGLHCRSGSHLSQAGIAALSAAASVVDGVAVPEE